MTRPALPAPTVAAEPGIGTSRLLTSRLRPETDGEGRGGGASDRVYGEVPPPVDDTAPRYEGGCDCECEERDTGGAAAKDFGEMEGDERMVVIGIPCGKRACCDIEAADFRAD